MFFDDADEVKELLNGAEIVRTLSRIDHNPYGQALFNIPALEVKDLYSGQSGAFIVHREFWRGWPLYRERVLSLPNGAKPEACLAYEAAHKEDYSRWYDMIEVMEKGTSCVCIF